jgi:hypothetical protein
MFLSFSLVLGWLGSLAMVILVLWLWYLGCGDDVVHDLGLCVELLYMY